ncbi:MAG TPA: hypothetical protein VEX68_16070 [Bryobacteraceae bacterium]|nr:hypothetical protein [Bryobacteraceae bacterium]
MQDVIDAGVIHSPNMPTGSIVFVHGTGARLKDYQSTFDTVVKLAAANGIAQNLVECAWGDPLGVEFEGLSLPDEPPAAQKAARAEEFARWSWLFDDPLFELDKLTIRDTSSVDKSIPPPGIKPPWLILWEKVESYRGSLELGILLKRSDLEQVWPAAWSAVVEGSPVPKQAFEASAHELPDACRALARALVAELHVRALAAGKPGPSRTVRDALVERMIVDWDQRVFGLGTFLANLFKRAATTVVRHHRASFSAGAALPIGDILLYQSRGEGVRDFIRYKIENAEPPVTLVAHSLGGIACVDLLASPNPPKVNHMVTAGSQAPLLYEIGALHSRKPPEGLPEGFPPWLNFFDRDDFLSYVAHRVFPEVEDVEMRSGQPFADSHGAYFGDPDVWKRIAAFTSQ